MIFLRKECLHPLSSFSAWELEIPSLLSPLALHNACTSLSVIGTQILALILTIFLYFGFMEEEEKC